MPKRSRKSSAVSKIRAAQRQATMFVAGYLEWMIDHPEWITRVQLKAPFKPSWVAGQLNIVVPQHGHPDYVQWNSRGRPSTTSIADIIRDAVKHGVYRLHIHSCAIGTGFAKAFEVLANDVTFQPEEQIVLSGFNVDIGSEGNDFFDRYIRHGCITSDVKHRDCCLGGNIEILRMDYDRLSEKLTCADLRAVGKRRKYKQCNS